MFNCQVCGTNFSRKYNLLRHTQDVHEKQKKFECEVCERGFTRRGNLIEHQLSHATVRRSSPSDQGPPSKRQRLDIAFVDKDNAHYHTVRCYSLQSDITWNDLWIMYKTVKGSLSERMADLLTWMSYAPESYIPQSHRSPGDHKPIFPLQNPKTGS